MSLPATRTLKKILQLLQNTKYVRQTHKRIDGIFDLLFEKKGSNGIDLKLTTFFKHTYSLSAFSITFFNSDMKSLSLVIGPLRTKIFAFKN